MCQDAHPKKIRSLKALSEQSDLENTVDVEEVIRYFVVHNFLCNGDSYTGQMIHNYYLYEEDGQLSMIPWDYNLAYGSFMGGNGSSSVNAAIDTPVSGGMSDRPMVSWIFSDEEYTEMYHELFAEFIDSVDFGQLVADTAALIDEYVEKDPTKFCTNEEFKTGVEAISKFCTLREESVSGQLDGSIPSTSEGQSADSSALVDASDLNTSDMGSMGGGMGAGFGGGKGGFGERSESSDNAEKSDSTDKSEKSKPESSEGKISLGGTGQSATMLSNFTISAIEDEDDSNDAPPSGRPPQGGGFGGQMPDGFDPENMPEGFDPSQGFGGEMPSDFDPENMPDGFEPSGSATTAVSGKNSPDTTTTAVGGKAPSNGEDTTRTRPQMGSFPDMGGAQKGKDPMVLVLLGASALILMAGLGFAFAYKRR